MFWLGVRTRQPTWSGARIDPLHVRKHEHTLALCFDVDLGNPGLSEIPDQAWQFCKVMLEREGWEINLVTHFHL